MTDSNASAKKQTKINVAIPVRATITVPVEIEITGDVSAHAYGEYNGDTLVDAEEHPEWLEAAVEAANRSGAVETALVELMKALMHAKMAENGTKAFYTPFAGVIDEREL